MASPAISCVRSACPRTGRDSGRSTGVMRLRSLSAGGRSRPTRYLRRRRASSRGARWSGTANGTARTAGRTRGIKLTAEEVARGIVQPREAGETIGLPRGRPVHLLHRTAARRSPSGWRRYCGRWRRADNARVGRNGALGRLGSDAPADRGRRSDPDVVRVRDLPGFHPHRARSCSTTPTDPKTWTPSAEDHVADEARYACMSRPLAAACGRPSNPVGDAIRLRPRRSRRQLNWKVA